MVRYSLALLIAFGLLLTLGACRSAPDEASSSDPAPEASGPSDSEEPQPEEPRPEEPQPEASHLYDFQMTTITGEDRSLSDFDGQVLLFVNVASECGFTRQYSGLQELYERFEDQGFAVLGFPADNFGGQEPGTDEEIQAFCENQFGVTFPMFSKISVTGEDQHPLYAFLTREAGEEITWNFNKILVDRSGEVIAHFPSPVEPLSDELIGAVEDLL